MSSKDTGLILLLALALGAGAGLFASSIFGRKEDEGAMIKPYTPPPTPSPLLLPPSGITAADLAASEARSAEAFTGLNEKLAALGLALQGANGSTKSGRDSASKIRRARELQAQIPDIQASLTGLTGEFRAMDIGLQQTLAESKAGRRRAISSISESRAQIISNLATRSRLLGDIGRQGMEIRREASRLSATPEARIGGWFRRI